MKTINSIKELSSLDDLFNYGDSKDMWMTFEFQTVKPGIVDDDQNTRINSKLKQIKKLIDDSELIEQCENALNALSHSGVRYLIAVSKQKTLSRCLSSQVSGFQPQYLEDSYLVPAALDINLDKPSLTAVVSRTEAEISICSMHHCGEIEHISGESDDVHKSKADPWHQSRHQNRVELRWQENLNNVAERCVEICKKNNIETVFISGDVRASGFLKKSLNKENSLRVFEEQAGSIETPAVERRSAFCKIVETRLYSMMDEIRTEALESLESSLDGQISDEKQAIKLMGAGKVKKLLIKERIDNNNLLKVAIKNQVEVVIFKPDDARLKNMFAILL